MIILILVSINIWVDGMASIAVTADGKNHHAVVADSLTRMPLAKASLFDHRGQFIGMCNNNGTITCASQTDYPLTIRCLGYREKVIGTDSHDTVFLQENVALLPEVTVETRQKRLLHILAYVREYSTLSSYTDTVTMFREKMVDFMLPADAKTRFNGWRYPRVLNSKSYYRFTDNEGLDSVSNRCNYHFTWSDWVGIFPAMQIPAKLALSDSATDTVAGRYGPSEIWAKDDGRISLHVDVLADTAARKWVPGIFSFFRNEDADFDHFQLRVNYNNVVGSKIDPLDLTGYSFNIESKGRGHRMFRFTRHDQPFYVTTYTEVYILDKEFISKKEAKKWDMRKLNREDMEIFEPLEAPELQPSILALINRVNMTDSDKVRLGLKTDHMLKSRNVRKGNFNIGRRALSMLKQLTGVTYYKSHKNFKRNWNSFREERMNKTEQNSGSGQ